ncbi:MAG: hypothetical protein KC592_15590 [Nitrospira sp.]|nr:hypothetical protein [Nitrospira sp.]
MKFRKVSELGLISVGMVTLILFGCVRVNIQTQGAPKAPYFLDQPEIKVPISISRFDGEDTRMSVESVEDILNQASLVAKCGIDNPEASCAHEFTDMHNDYGCNIKFTLENAPSSGNVGFVNWPPTFSLPSSSTGLTTGNVDPLDCLADGFICSPSDLEAVWGAEPRNKGIKIVRDINFCEGTEIPEGEEGWAACAQFPHQGQAIAMKKHPEKDTKLKGILWLHEYGHTRDLHHIPNALSKDQNGVMRSGVSHSKTKLSRQECYRLREDFQ